MHHNGIFTLPSTQYLNKMNNIKTLTTAMAITLAAMTVSGQNTQKLSTSKANDYGLAYSLPTTVVDVVIVVNHTETTPGEFYNYARQYLDVDNVIVDASQSAAVSEVTLIPRGEVVDGAEVWLVKFKSGANVSMTLTEGSVPMAINNVNITVDPPVAPKLPEGRKALPTALEVPAAQQAVTREMSATSSLSMKARLAAQRIFELRETRNELLSGQAENMPPDGKALELILENLNAQEAALMAMFTGTTKEYTTVSVVPYMLKRDDMGEKVIARLSPTDGLIAADDLSGDPVTVTISNVAEGKMPVNDKGETKPFPKGGVAYTIPGSATLTVSCNGTQFVSQNMDFAQLGITYGLEPSHFTDKKKPVYVEFSPVTGAIVHLDPLPVEK